MAIQRQASDLSPSVQPTEHRDKRSRTDGSALPSDPAGPALGLAQQGNLPAAQTQAGAFRPQPMGARSPGVGTARAVQSRAAGLVGPVSPGALPHSPVQPREPAVGTRGASGAGQPAAPPGAGPGHVQTSPAVPSLPWAGARELGADDWAAIEWVRRHQPNLGPQHQCLKPRPPHRAAPPPAGVGPFLSPDASRRELRMWGSRTSPG